MEAIQEIFAAQGKKRWSLAQSSSRDRIVRLKKLRDAIGTYQAQILDAAYSDLKRHRTETELVEIFPTISELEHLISSLSFWMEPKPVPGSLAIFGAKSEIQYVARGRTLIIGPWNYPFQLTVIPLAAAVAAGNPVILKPSELAPAMSRVVREMISSVFPPHEVAVVEGGVDVSTRLLELPFDHFFYTGGATVGRIVMQAAAKHLSAVTLELGGKSPVIVDEHVSLQRVAERVTWGKLLNFGQTCVAPDYIWVPRSRERELVERIKACISSTYGRTPEEQKQSPDLARMASSRHLDRLRGLVEQSVVGGAQLECGGVYDPLDRFISPTVLTGVNHSHPVMKEELFGPVLPVIAYDRIEDVLEKIREGDAPLALYVFSDEKKFVQQVLNGTTSGGALVNDVIVHLANPHLPFGGVGPSGLGSYHGFHGFRAFSHERSVVRQARFSSAKVFYPPYTAKIKRLIGIARKFL